MEKYYKLIGYFALILSVICILCSLFTFYGIWIDTTDFNLFPGSKIFNTLFAFSTLNLDFSNKFEQLEIWNFVFYTLLLIGSIQFLNTKGRETRLLGFVFSVIFLSGIPTFLMSTYFKIFITKWGEMTSLQIFNSLLGYIVLIGIVAVSFKILKIIKGEKEIDIIETEHRKTITDTNKWQRFFHWLIDVTVMMLIFTPLILNIINRIVDSDSLTENDGLRVFLQGRGALYVIGFIILFIYYPISEILFGSSPAKFLTESRIISSKAESPKPSTIFLRTLCRNIPFDALSFFTEKGWHDSLSGTFVVKEKRTGFKTSKLLWILPILFVYLVFMYFGKKIFSGHW